MSEEQSDVGNIIYRSLNGILQSAVVDLSDLLHCSPTGPIRDNISNYLEAFTTLRRLAKVLLEGSDE